MPKFYYKNTIFLYNSKGLTQLTLLNQVQDKLSPIERESHSYKNVKFYYSHKGFKTSPLERGAERIEGGVCYAWRYYKNAQFYYSSKGRTEIPIYKGGGHAEGAAGGFFLYKYTPRHSKAMPPLSRGDVFHFKNAFFYYSRAA